MAAIGLIGGLATVAAPEAAARPHVWKQIKVMLKHPDQASASGLPFASSSTTAYVPSAPYDRPTTPNPVFANISPDVQKALKKAGSFSRSDLGKIKKQCTKQYPNEPDGSRTLGACMLDGILNEHVPMINGQPWADRPELTTTEIQSISDKCKAQTTYYAAYGSCMTTWINYFYGL